MELIDRRLMDRDPSAGKLSAKEKRDRLHQLVKEAQTEAQQQQTAGHNSQVSWSDLRDFFEGPGQNWDKVSPNLPTHLQDDWSTTNHVKAACKAFVSTIVGALPAWYVVELGTGEPDDAADRVTTYLRAWKQFIGYDGEEKLAVNNAVQVGRGILKPWWD